MTPEQKRFARAALQVGALGKPALRILLAARPTASGPGLLEEAIHRGLLDAAGAGRVAERAAELTEADERGGPPDASAREERQAKARREAEARARQGLPAIKGYEVREVIGRGAAATVYRALHLALQKPVALKVLSERLAQSEEDRARFLREARAAARISHPNVVKIYDTGVSNDRPFLAMELVEGWNLDRRVRREGPLGEREVLEIAVALTRALGAAETAGIVHRDVKPANVIVGGAGQVKLCDLGLARSFSRGDAGRITEHGVTLGTPLYLSPEQARGEPLDSRSDLYSLGATLFFLATGRPPFPGPTGPAVMRRHLEDEPEPPSSVRPGVGRAYDLLVLRLLSKDPKSRPQTARQAEEELQQVLAGETPLPPTPPPRKSPRAQRAQAALTAASRRPRRDRRQLLAAAIAYAAIIYVALVCIRALLLAHRG